MKATARRRWAHRFLRSCVLSTAIAGTLTLVAAPIVAQAASRSEASTQARQIAAHTATPLSSSICSKVSAASVSAIVGYSVPAATTYTHNLAATTQNGGISEVSTACTFGAGTTVATLSKDVTLSVAVTSKPLTTSEVQKSLTKQSSATLKITASSSSSLGVPAVYFTETGEGLSAEGIGSYVGTKTVGASVEHPVPMSKLVALWKLAKNL